MACLSHAANSRPLRGNLHADENPSRAASLGVMSARSILRPPRGETDEPAG